MQKLFKIFTSEKNSSNFWIILGVFYCITHLLNLTGLPVFADESIYIRWSQLIMDEPLRYLFFALNDGKTPFFIWLLVPFQYLFENQLFAARFVSVAIGLFQILATVLVVRKLSGSQISQRIAAILVVILPFWYLHHRMALMDGLLTVFLTFALWGTLHCIDTSKCKPWFWIGVTAVSIGAAFWTKLPAVLALPALSLFIFQSNQIRLKELFPRIISLGIAMSVGIVLFAVMRISPAFGQLFARGSDFLYPISDVLFGGVWRQTLPNIPTYFSYLSAYLSLGVLVLLITGVSLQHPHRKSVILLTLAGFAFIIPIAIFGKVVYPRYMLPAALFFTPAAALTLESLLAVIPLRKKSGVPLHLYIVFCLLSVGLTSGNFMLRNLANPDATQFVKSDKVQYLTEWSSGHGIKETTELIQEEAQDTTIAVATEGYFGTLPDGILLYLHAKSVENLWVEGIGQPVTGIPQSFIDRAKEYKKSWLVVNSHRMKISLPPTKLLREYCRPYNGPCLQVWDITDYVSNPPPNN